MSEGYTNIRKYVFILVFALHLMIGGFLAFSGIIPFRPFYTTVLVLLFAIVYKIKIDVILKFHLWFGLLIIISGFVNSSSFGGLLMGLRIPVISYTMYLVVKSYPGINNMSLEKIIKWIAVIQLPIIIFQILFYSQLSTMSAIPTSSHDIRYGSFFVKSDPTMSTFLILIVIYLLFLKKEFSVFNTIVIVTSCTSVFLASSRISQLTLILIMGFYIFLNSTFKQKVYALPAICIIIGIFYLTGYFSQLQYQLNQSWQQLTFQSEGSLETFKEGGYSRAAAVLYFLSEPLKIIGDGPGHYVNPLSNKMELGLTGEYFKVYAELGLLGLVTSVGGIFLIVFSKLKKGLYRYWIVIVFLGLGITADLYNDASLMFVFYLMIYVILNDQKVIPRRVWLIKS